MRLKSDFASLFLSGTLFVVPAASAAETDYSEVWDHFVILVWQYQVPPPGPAAKRAYESVNLHGIHLDWGFSDELLDFARENGYEFYVDHAAGKGDLYLRREAWQEFFAAYRQNRQRPVRPNCLRDPAVRERMKGLLREHVTRAKVGRVVGYAFDDEISVTSFTNPADVCWCARCLAAFRDWLREQYGTVEALNAEWDTAYADFQEAEPLHVDDLREVHQQPFHAWNLARWADHRRFMDTTFAEVLAELTATANEADPRVPAGFVGGQAPAAYGGYDYARLARAVQWMEAYDIGATNEILRSFWGQRKPHVQTFFSSLEPYRDQWFLWYYFVHGNRGVICWPESDGKPWFEGDRARPEIEALADTFQELQGRLGQIFVGAEFQPDPIAIYYSQPSIQLSWFMDIQPHGSTWINRSSSLNNDNATDLFNRWAWLKWLEDSGFQAEFVSYLDVREKGLNPDRYKVLILPRTLALSEAEAAAITRFAESGGLVVADYLCGVFDEHGKGREKGVLDDLFGVTHDFSQGVLDGKNIAEINGELYQQPLSRKLMYDGALREKGFVVYERGLSARSAAAIPAVNVRRVVGPGQAIYLNLTPIEYLLKRGTSDGQAYRDFLSQLLRGAGLEPRVQAFRGEEEQPLIERLFWRKAGRTYLCLVQNALRAAQVDAAGESVGISAGPPVTLRLRFTRPVTDLRNERTGQALGEGQEFEDAWMPCEANVYSFAGP